MAVHDKQPGSETVEARSLGEAANRGTERPIAVTERCPHADSPWLIGTLA